MSTAAARACAFGLLWFTVTPVTQLSAQPIDLPAFKQSYKSGCISKMQNELASKPLAYIDVFCRCMADSAVEIFSVADLRQIIAGLIVQRHRAFFEGMQFTCLMEATAWEHRNDR